VSWWHGLFFAVVAWLQLSWAVGVVLRPTRQLLGVGVVLNAAVLGVWMISRIWGVPVGPDAWTPEDVSFADALASALEGLIVVGSLGVLVRPALANRAVSDALGVPGVAFAVLGVAVFSSLALTPGFASGHGHGGHAADAVVDVTPCGRSGEPVFQGQNPNAHQHRGPAPWEPLRDETVRAEYAGQVQRATACSRRTCPASVLTT
jgi:hypothetical protein